MTGEPQDFWGKLEVDKLGTVTQWHPLIDHCADVAACTLALLEDSILRDRLASLAGRDLDRGSIERLCVLAAFHDVGKFNLGFQNKAWPHRGGLAGHVGPVIDLLHSPNVERDLLLNAVDAEALDGWGEAVLPLLLASICHHGRPIQPGLSPRPKIWQLAFGLDPIQGMAELASATKRWFPAAWQTPEDPLPESPHFQHAFSGLVMLADWLGSDQRFFPYSQPGGGARFEWARPTAHHALEQIGLSPKKARAHLGPGSLDFGRIAPFEPRPMQRALFDSSMDDDRGLAVLEAETGAGKTEAALAWFLRLYQKGRVDGLYFALPTRTAATQLHRRVVEAIERAFPQADARPPVVLAVPGYLAVDDRMGSRLPGFEVLWNDDEAARYRYRGWAAENPKRYLAGAIVVGTVDQLLLSALAVNHSHLRATASLRQLLVVDEVHASDAYMTRLTEAVIRRHIRAGGWGLLMSATLGAEAFTRLAQAAGCDAEMPDKAEAIARPYPAIAHVGSTGTDRAHCPAATESEKRVVATLRPLIADPVAIAHAAIDAATRGAKVLIIRNTVRDCLATQLSLEQASEERRCAALLFTCAGVAAPHHSRFSRGDRQQLDQALEGSFGGERAVGGCIAVATQTVQQSLDIDADWMITDLCPMDVLLQRLGRLHRHSYRRRPEGHADPRATVLIPADRDLMPLIRQDGRAFGSHGFGTVYEDLRILEATWRTLELHETLCVPAMNRLLVEEATHPEALDAVVASMAGAWKKHEHYITGVTLAEVRMASRALANWSAPFDAPECQFPSAKLEGRIQTRLGEGDRIAFFEPAFEGPFGLPVRRLTIPAWLARDAEADEQPLRTQSTRKGTTFEFGKKAYQYDRHGLHQMTAAPEEDLADA